MAGTKPRFVIAMPRSRLWLIRLPFLVGMVVGVIAIGRALTWTPSGNSVLGSATFVFATILIFLVLIRFNRMGISLDGLLPPEKPLSALFEEAWVLPWSAVNEVEVLPVGRLNRRGGQRLRIRISSAAHPMDWYVMSPKVYRLLGRRPGARFIEMLSAIEHGIKEEGRPLTRDEVKLYLGL